jgi:hypothetical protein
MNEQYLERYEIEARRIKQREAARAMLAALGYLLNIVDGVHDVCSLQRAKDEARAAIAQATAAGIKAEG